MGSAISERQTGGALMRLIVVTTSYPLTSDSVSGVFVQRLVANLPETVEKIVVTPCGCGPSNALNGSDIHVHCFRYAPTAWQKLAHQPGGVLVALRTCRWLQLLLPIFVASMFFSCLRHAFKSDLLHANWSINGLIAGLAGFLTRTPVVTTLRGEDVNRLEKSHVGVLALRLCMLFSDRIVAVSNAIGETVARRFPKLASKVLVIPNGVHDSLLKLSRRPGDHEVRAVTIGSLIPLKQIDHIILAVSKLSDLDNLHLNVVGDGPEYGSHQSLIRRLHLKHRVHLTGQVEPHDVPRHLEDADIFVLASEREGRPNVVLEAMAAGLPVIASNIAGVDELIQHGVNGLLFEPGDIPQLVDHLSYLTQHHEARERLGSAGRRFIVENQLTWSETGQRYYDLYQEVIHS